MREVAMLFALALTFVLAQTTPALQATGDSAQAGCDDACARARAHLAAGAFREAAARATNPDIQTCFTAWADFDEQVARVGPAGSYPRSPQSLPACRGAAVASTGNPNATGSVNVTLANGTVDTQTAQIQGQAMAQIAGVAMSAAMGSTLDAAGLGQLGELGSMLGGMFGGGGSADDRDPFDQATFDRISANADQIMDKLQPGVTYSYVMALQRTVPANLDGNGAAARPQAVARAASSGTQVASSPSGGRSLASRADGGDALAQYALGLEYWHGDGRAKDPVLAYKWLRLAALHGNDNAQTLADQVFVQLSPAQRAAAKALLEEYKSEHANG